MRVAASYIRDRWVAQSYAAREQSYDVDGLRCANLETALPVAPARPLIIIGAHYDSVLGSPGANDNASGVATLLELSGMFAETSSLPLRFVAFANEEPPFFATALQGSEIYARQLRRDGSSVKLMISLETLGYYSVHEGSQRYPPLVERFYPSRGELLGRWRGEEGCQNSEDCGGAREANGKRGCSVSDRCLRCASWATTPTARSRPTTASCCSRTTTRATSWRWIRRPDWPASLTKT
jgi:hypothetical protein